MASLSPTTLFGPGERLAYARHLLDEAAHGGQAELQEFAAFLLLLEVFACLQSQKLAGRRSSSDDRSHEADEGRGEPATGGLASYPDVEGVRTPSGDADEAGVSGSAGVEGASAEWRNRSEYLRAVYLDEPQSADPPVPQPPLATPPKCQIPLRDVCSSERPTKALLLSLVTVLLESLVDSHLSSPSPPLTADMLITQLPSSTLPTPLPSSTVSSLTASLASAKTARSEVSRRTLSTILSHYVSSKSFGVRDVVEEGKVWYAQDPQDDERIKRIYRSSAATTLSVSAVPSDASEDEDADTRSIAAGIREAQESIARKDKKLEWLLGNNFQKGCNRSEMPSSTSNSKRWRSTTAPTSSFGSSGSSTIRGDAPAVAPTVSRTRETSYESAASTGEASRHTRMVSTSSTAPLLARCSKETFDHRLEPAIKGEPMLADAVANVHINEDPEKPFADLAPALPHSASCNRPLLSPRRSSLDSSLDHHLGTATQRSHRAARPAPLLTKNALTADEKRELVRRSKKLEGFFGASFHEDAARKVLVGARGQASGQPEVSQTAATFARHDSADSAHGGRRDSLAPPYAGRAGPTPGYSFGAYRRPSLLSNSLSHSSMCLSASARGSTGSASPLASPRSPTFPTTPRMQRSSSSPSRRSSSFSSMTSPEYAYFSAEPRRPSTLEREEQQRLREERRKKLEKVTRLLGERVPPQLVVGTQHGALEAWRGEPGDTPITRSRSKGGIGRLKGKLGFGGPHAPPSQDESSERGDAGWDYVQPQWTAPTDEAGGADTVRTAGSAVDALTKARKLESLFGDLPPPSLYLAPAPPTSSSYPRRPLHNFRHRRSVSDITASYSPFSPHATAGGWAPQTLPNAPLSRAQTRSTVNSLRQSIASLSYAMERDPAALDEVVRAYASSSEDDMATPHAGSTDFAVSTDEAESSDSQDAPVMTRSASAQSHRAVKQAHKLSHFFGTTRGEVWRMLLDDIQASVLEDETVDEDERAELICSLDRLREKV